MMLQLIARACLLILTFDDVNKVPTDDSPLAISSNSGSAQDNSVSDEDEADQGESSIMSIEAASRTASKRKKGDNQQKEGIFEI